MKKIWRKDKSRNSDQVSSQSTRRNQIDKIDELSIDSEATVILADKDLQKLSLSKINTNSSLANQRRTIYARASKSNLNKVAKGPASLVKSEWDQKLTKSGWLNRSNSEFTEESLKMYRAELKGPYLHIYKTPNDLSNIKHFKIASESEIQDSLLEVNSMVSSSTMTDLQAIKQPEISPASPAIAQDLNSLRKPNAVPTIQFSNSHDDIFNPPPTLDDAHSLKSKSSMPLLSTLPGSLDELSQSSLSLSPTKTPSTQSSTINPDLLKLTYYSPKYPHPNLVVDSSTQAILSGDLESICHAILFNTFVQKDGDNNKVSKHLLSLLPLFGDITTSFLYFRKYSDLFISEQESDDFKENLEDQMVIPRKTEAIMTERLVLVINYIKDNFPGMLLEASIFKSIWDLIVSLESHTSCLDLKVSVHVKQGTLYSLLNEVETENQSLDTPKELQSLTFLKTDLQDLAMEINSINLKFNKVWNPQSDCSLLFESIHDSYSYYRKNPLIFDSSKNIHYLGRLLVDHLFLDTNVSRKSSKRAKIITKWVELGSYFDKIGDMVSWLAIATIICSIPVLRLQKTWDNIDPEVIRIVSTDWAPVVFELDRRSMISDASHRSSYHVIAPQGIGELYPKENVIPYFGDLYVKKPDSLTIKQCERKTQRVIVSLNRWQDYVLSVSDSTTIPSLFSGSGNSEISSLLYRLFNYHVSRPPLTLKDIMSHSLEVEPSSNGVFNKFHDSARSPLFLGSYPSVIFPQIIPKYKVYDQKALIGAIGNDSSTSSVYDDTKTTQFNVVNSMASKVEGTSSEFPKGQQKPGRNQFLKNLRDIFNIESTDLHVSDSIIFKSMIPEGEEETPVSPVVKSDTLLDLNLSFDESDQSMTKEDSTSITKPRSRPSSVLFNESASTKRYSNYASNLDDFQKQVAKASKDEASICEMFTKAATLDRLIDLLVLTSNIFVSEIKREDVDEYFSNISTNSKTPTLKMDNGVYTVTFFATYRSFCSTSRLLQELLKRFTGAKAAAISIYNRRENLAASQSSEVKEIPADYPLWDECITETHSDYHKVVWKYVAQIQIGILEALISLVKDHYDHFVNDLTIRDCFVDILKIIDNEVIIEWTKVLSDLSSKSNSDEQFKKQFTEINEHYDEILHLYKKLRKVYIKKSYKPLSSEFKSPVFSSSLSSIPEKAALPEFSDIKGIEEFIDEFDELVGILFTRVSVDDLLNVFEIIEVQAGKTTTGLFNYQMQKLSTPDEDLIISDVFGWFATLYDTNESTITREYAVNRFPPAVKAIIQLYYKFKTYIVAQITDPTISQEVRVKRMKSILVLLSVSRHKMKGVDLFSSKDADSCGVSPHVPSLIETTLLNCIVSPESRLFAESWIVAVNSFKKETELTSVERFDSFVPSDDLFDPSLLKSNATLTPCIGWLSERLIEIACYVPNMSVSNTKLINFDKRRYVYNCIANILSLKDPIEGEASTNIENFKFLFKLKDDGIFDISKVKEAAKLETKSETIPILFKSLIDEERVILRKEHTKKEFLTKQEKERRNAAQRNGTSIHLKGLSQDSSHDSTSLALTKVSKRQSVIDSPSKSRFKFSLFNKPSKLFSFGAHNSNPDRIIRNIDLPEASLYSDQKMKPSVVLNLKDLTIFPIYRVQAALKIDGPNNTEYFFQALDELDKQDWIYQLNYARRHWFFSKSLNRNASPHLIFGVPLDYICARESSVVPIIIDKLMTEIEVRGLEEVGIYRKSASLSVLNLLRTEIDKYGDFNMENHLIFDINNATGCVKSFLREIPDSLIPDELIPEFGQVRQEGLEFDDRLLIYKSVLPKLPYHNYHLLKRLIRHLKVVDEYSEYNKMTASNLSTIIGAIFTEAAGPELTKKYFGLMNFVCEDMIKHYAIIFEQDK